MLPSMNAFFSFSLAAFLFALSPSIAASQDATPEATEKQPEPDLKVCDEWKTALVTGLEAQLEKVGVAYKLAQKDKNKEEMKALLAKKKELSLALNKAKAKTAEDCWATILDERAAAKAKEAENARQRAVWDAAENAQKTRQETAAAKAAADREFLRAERERLKKGRKILTRDEFKEKVRVGLSPAEVIEAVGAPDKTQESGESKSYVYYKKTIDDLTGKDDALVMVSFWKGRVRSVTIP